MDRLFAASTIFAWLIAIPLTLYLVHDACHCIAKVWKTWKCELTNQTQMCWLIWAASVAWIWAG